LRKPLIAGNWKMYKTGKETVDFCRQLKTRVGDKSDREILICPPFPSLQLAREELEGTKIGLGAQNMYWEQKGAFTGEVSADMLKDSGCEYVIVGHSERRAYFGETDETVHRKVKSAISQGLIPIVCIGERLEERESGKTMDVLTRQFEGGLSGIQLDRGDALVVAYEPVWAIGTGKTATTEIAQEAHLFIREQLRKLFGELAEEIRILYGGSIKPANISGLMACKDIDGGLVGGASLEVDSFITIIDYKGGV